GGAWGGAGRVGRAPNALVARAPQGAGAAARLSVADLEDEESRRRRGRDRLVHSRADQRLRRLVAELGLQALERLDVGRVRDDEVPAFPCSVEASFAELEIEPKPLGVLARERERRIRYVDAGHACVGPLVLQCERDGAGADADVEDPGGLDIREQREAALDDDLRLRPRHERAFVDSQDETAKAPLSEHIREWL